MVGSISCQLHQALGYANTRLGIGMGCCQLDGDYTTCNGDVGFCEKPNLLIQVCHQTSTDATAHR